MSSRLVWKFVGDQMNDGVDKRCFAGPGSANDEDVSVIERGLPDEVALAGRHRFVADIVFQREDAAGALADAKTWPSDDRRDHPFETAAVRQIAFKDRANSRDGCSVDRRKSGHGGLGLMRRHLAEARHRAAETLNP